MTLSQIKPGMRVAFVNDEHDAGPGTVLYVHMAFAMVKFDASTLFIVPCHPSALVELESKDSQ